MNPVTVTIALVENDRATSKALSRLLGAHGYAVQVFHSAESYLAGAGEASIDCLLLDVDLDGMSGLELQRRMGMRGDAVPIVFMTGRDDANIEMCAREMGCAGFLYKPFDGRTLASALARALAGAGGGDALL
jgi:FixJ family two-component response regulator